MPEVLARERRQMIDFLAASREHAPEGYVSLFGDVEPDAAADIYRDRMIISFRRGKKLDKLRRLYLIPYYGEPYTEFVARTRC